MQIPFEFDPPKKDEDSSLKSKESELPDSEDTMSLQAKKPLTVTQLTRQITLLLEGEFRSLAVEGELSNVKKAASGHWYFSLKDDQSQIRCAMFRNIADNLRFDPEDGLEVVVRGHLTVYQQRGDYQIKVSYMEPKGLGALQLAYEQLKSRLEAEGLFDQQYKRALPFLPRRIGIVTSPKGAVIHDMLTVLERRFPGIPVLLFPSQVQGNSAPKMLVEGIRHLNTLRDSQQIDVLIVGRGGGSIEDLWAFNDEQLARAIFSSEIPVISAVGHETDFTIADFVSDVRAPTPSAAMEIAVPNKMDLKHTLSQKEEQLHHIILNQLERLNEYVEAMRQRLASPAAVVQQYVQQVDDLDSLLRERTRNLMENFHSRITSVSEKLLLLNPGRELAAQKHGVELLHGRLTRSIRHLQEKLEDSVKLQTDLLDSLSPLSVLHRGYSVAMDKSGNLLRSVKDVQSGEELQVRLEDGTLQTKVTSVKPQQ